MSTHLLPTLVGSPIEAYFHPTLFRVTGHRLLPTLVGSPIEA